MPRIMVEIDSQKVGKNRLSEGCCSDLGKAFGQSTKRVVIADIKQMKRIRLKMNTMHPIVVRPRNLWGVWFRRVASPPVDTVRVNQAHVK
jgi:hypothetical protein